MSRLWRDRLLVGVCRDHAEIVRLAGPISRRVRDTMKLPWVPQEGRFDTLLEALHGFFSDAAEAQVTFVLSHDFVRYLIVPWSARLHGKEREVYARHRFEAVYGTAAEPWAVKVSIGRYGEPWLASAVDEGLVAGLLQVTHGSRCRVASIQPYCMAVMNRAFRHLPRGNRIILISEPSRCCIITIRDRCWNTVTMRDMPNSDSGRLLAVLARESLLSGLPESAPVLAWGQGTENLVGPAFRAASSCRFERPNTDISAWELPLAAAR